MGVAVSVGSFGVGEASNETWVSSDATVSAVWVNASPGEVGVDCAPGRLQPTRTMIKIKVKLKDIFFMIISFLI
jgi:hypothetical protein